MLHVVILCRAMSYRIRLVCRFASLESRKHESLRRVRVKSGWLESLLRVYAVIIDMNR